MENSTVKDLMKRAKQYESEHRDLVNEATCIENKIAKHQERLRTINPRKAALVEQHERIAALLLQEQGIKLSSIG